MVTLLNVVVRGRLRTAILAGLLITSPSALGQSPATQQNCEKDAILVFDASGSMTGMGFGERSVRRIEQVRRALAQVLPSVAPVRHLGLIVFGPGPRGVCENIDLRLPPGPNSAGRIMAEVEGIQPYGQTPLTSAVTAAAGVLNYRDRPAVIVLLTDGEETCHGSPCALAQRLVAEGADVTVHVVGYMLRLATEPTGNEFARCLSERTGGMFISTETTDELIEALRKTLGCPLLSSLGESSSSASDESRSRSPSPTSPTSSTRLPPRSTSSPCAHRSIPLKHS
jgi:Ca-activated chloride channel family protein